MVGAPTGYQPWLTTAEMARDLRVPTATVRRHADSLGGVRVGRQLRFPQPAASTLNMGQRGPTPVKGRLR